MDEIFDIVNERDEVVGQAPRAKVHAEGLLHRAVHVLVFNQRGQVFLQKRSMLKDQCPGVWGTSCAGHLDAGEDYDTAAKREFGEELGIEAPELERLFKLEACVETGHEFVWVYRCNAEGPFTLHPMEIDGGEWFEPKALTQEMNGYPERFAPSARYVWSAYQKG